MKKRFKSNTFLQTMGPGILFASTAIGVSHLIQSTKAGANFGFTLIIFVIAANVFKFPFFEYGSRYAIATKTSLLDGYNKLGRVYLVFYVFVTLCSMFFVTAAVSYVAAGFFENLFQIEWSNSNFYLSSLGLLTICFLILFIGQYDTLDTLIKIVSLVLLFTTIAATFLVLLKGIPNTSPKLVNTSLLNISAIPFIIALMGWMPTAVDLSSWNSLWTLERIKQSGYTPSVKQTILEFNIGYWISAALSICFLTIGAFMVYANGEVMPNENVPFAAKVISLFTNTFGTWSFYLIAMAAFAIMFGTSIGVIDGYSRTLSSSFKILLNNKKNIASSYKLWLAVVCLGAFLIILFFRNQFSSLINFATILSFLIAPFIAILNLHLVTSTHLKEEDQPGKKLRILSYIGIIFLSAFSILYLYFKIKYL